MARQAKIIDAATGAVVTRAMTAGEEAAIAVAAAVPPAQVTPLQMRRALAQLGLRTAVETAIAAAGTDAQDAWQYATVIVRADPIVAALTAALGKTDAEVDDLFRLAATLT